MVPGDQSSAEIFDPGGDDQADVIHGIHVLNWLFKEGLFKREHL